MPKNKVISYSVNNPCLWFLLDLYFFQRGQGFIFMFLAKVVGTVWATKKVYNVKNLRFLVVHPLNVDKAPSTNVVVVADTLGAGPGEIVICAYGHAARQAIKPADPPSLSIEAAVIGIVDKVEFNIKDLESM
jgi:ethanolamine utilization protein EutN